MFFEMCIAGSVGALVTVMFSIGNDRTARKEHNDNAQLKDLQGYISGQINDVVGFEIDAHMRTMDYRIGVLRCEIQGLINRIDEIHEPNDSEDDDMV